MMEIRKHAAGDNCIFGQETSPSFGTVRPREAAMAAPLNTNIIAADKYRSHRVAIVFLACHGSWEECDGLKE